MSSASSMIICVSAFFTPVFGTGETNCGVIALLLVLLVVLLLLLLALDATDARGEDKDVRGEDEGLREGDFLLPTVPLASETTKNNIAYYAIASYTYF